MVFEVHSGKMTFEEVIYKLVRCALLHDGELDSRIKFVTSPSIGLDNEGGFLLSEKMIIAFFLLLVSNRHNRIIQWPKSASFSIDGITINFSDIAGDPNKLVEIFRDVSKEKSLT